VVLGGVRNHCARCRDPTLAGHPRAPARRAATRLPSVASDMPEPTVREQHDQRLNGPGGHVTPARFDPSLRPRSLVLVGTCSPLHIPTKTRDLHGHAPCHPLKPLSTEKRSSILDVHLREAGPIDGGQDGGDGQVVRLTPTPKPSVQSNV
jgi:hypothetical protein